MGTGIKLVCFINEGDIRRSKTLGVRIFRQIIATRFQTNYQILIIQRRKQIVPSIEIDQKRRKKCSRRFLRTKKLIRTDTTEP